MWKVREIADKVTNVVMNYTEIEAKVREATNDEAWGPTGALMQEIAGHTFTYENFPEVMGMLWKRMLQDNKKNWRRTYKSLILLNYLVRNGSERVVTSAREHIYDLRSLENYTFIDEHGKDVGLNVRHCAKKLIEFIQDDDKLREERKKAKKNKDKYIGVASDMMTGPNRYSDHWDGGRKRDNMKYDFDDFDSKFGKMNVGSVYKDSPSSEPAVDADRGFSDEPETDSSTVNKSQKNISTANGNKCKLSSNNGGNKPKNTIDASKKIDLGAAMSLGKEDKSSTSKSANESETFGHKSNSDLLADIFSPADDAVVTNSNINDFADFSQFQNATTKASENANDDFTDFVSVPIVANSNAAFNQGVCAQPDSSSASAMNNPFLMPSLSQPISGVQTSNSLLQPISPFVSQQAVNPSVNLLTTNATLNQSQAQRPNNLFCTNSNINKAETSVVSTINSGTNTWSNYMSNVNINVDNLLSSKYEKPVAPSMNQLATNNTSGVNFGSLSQPLSPMSHRTPQQPLTPMQPIISPNTLAHSSLGSVR
ncbi:epsin-like protein, partial [Dinothrombium tinctorium]